jgi:hypothetical protein
MTGAEPVKMVNEDRGTITITPKPPITIPPKPSKDENEPGHPTREEEPESLAATKGLTSGAALQLRA